MDDVTTPPTSAVRKHAFGRSLGDFRIEGTTTPNGLLPAEEKLLVAVARGETCTVSTLDWKKPEDIEKLKSDEKFRIRARFLRFLALGGDEAAPVHERGVRFEYAFIEDDLDLQGCQSVAKLFFVESYFAGSLRLHDAHLRGLNLAGSRVGPIGGDGAKIIGDVVLRNGFTAEGEVRLPGTEIDGDLACIRGNFKNTGGVALTCDRARITGSAFFGDHFIAEGEVRLLGAEIGGDLSCNLGSFKNAGGDALNFSGAKITRNVHLSNGFTAEGTVQLLGAEIGGNLSCIGGSFKNAGDNALSCDRARITGTMFLRGGFAAEGTVSLAAAYAQNLNDHDVTSGKTVAGELVLDGFTYERISGGAPTDAKTRMAWLMRQRKYHLSTDFRPQPFEQLAKVLAAMGHDGDARQVAMAKQRLMIPVRVRQAAWYAKPFVWLLWRLHQWTSGFGYRPIRLIFILLALWLGGAWFYDQAAEAGVFAPADLRVATSPDLVAKCSANWTKCKDAGWLPGFYALTYSADVVLPVSDLGQRKVWTPSKRGFELWLLPGLTVPIPPGLTTHIVAVQSFLGSLGALLFGAIITGLIKKD